MHVCVCLRVWVSTDQDQVEQAATLRTLLKQRLFNFCLLWSQLPLHQSLHVILPRHISTFVRIRARASDFKLLPSPLAVCPQHSWSELWMVGAGTVPLSARLWGSSSQSDAALQSPNQTARSKSTPVPCQCRTEDLTSSSGNGERQWGWTNACGFVKKNACCLYLCSWKVMPGAVSEVGRGDVRVLFP